MRIPTANIIWPIEVKDKIGMARSMRRDVRNTYIQHCSGNMKARLKYVGIN